MRPPAGRVRCARASTLTPPSRLACGKNSPPSLVLTGRGSLTPRGKLTGESLSCKQPPPRPADRRCRVTGDLPRRYLAERCSSAARTSRTCSGASGSDADAELVRTPSYTPQFKKDVRPMLRQGNDPGRIKTVTRPPIVVKGACSAADLVSRPPIAHVFAGSALLGAFGLFCLHPDRDHHQREIAEASGHRIVVVQRARARLEAQEDCFCNPHPVRGDCLGARGIVRCP
jgi:hypothetical protein